MSYYMNKAYTDDRSGLIGKVMLILFGLLIGASMGLYIAVETLPLPSVTTNYITR